MHSKILGRNYTPAWSRKTRYWFTSLCIFWRSSSWHAFTAACFSLVLDSFPSTESSQKCISPHSAKNILKLEYKNNLMQRLDPKSAFKNTILIHRKCQLTTYSYVSFNKWIEMRSLRQINWRKLRRTYWQRAIE